MGHLLEVQHRAVSLVYKVNLMMPDIRITKMIVHPPEMSPES